MNAAALALLESDPIARRLVAAWPRVGVWRDDGKTLRLWARLSGVRPKEVMLKKDMLFGNEMCFPAGGAAPEAESYIAQLAMGKLPQPRAPRKPDRPEEKKVPEKKK